MKEIIIVVKRFLRNSFSLHEDKAEESLIIDSINRNVNFRGTNLWTLIFAILIASIGLNVNSTAVVIGAMLISPIMGPIMGIGLGIGILDFNLMKRGIKNLLIAAVFSIITSFIYFYVTPLHEANTELIARTRPSLWDVLIAFFGGLAGIIAGTRKEKSNILPGVAIATALMPPLCTAGYGLATQQFSYFFGALYLFFINSLFICLATFLIVRYLKFNTTTFATPAQQKRVVRYIWTIVVLTIIPSIYLATRIVQRAIFEQNAKRFVQHEFRFTRTQVVHQSYKFDDRKPSIELLLIGEELSPLTIDSLRHRMPLYALDSNSLTVHQGLDAKKEIDLAQIRASILEDIFVADSTKNSTANSQEINRELEPPGFLPELAALYPDIKKYSLSRTVQRPLKDGKNDTLVLFWASSKRNLLPKERKQLADWVVTKIQGDSVKVMIEYEK